MKRNSFAIAICLLLSITGFAQGGTCYLEFYGNGILHRGVLKVDAQGRGQCRIAYQSNQGVVVVDQQVHPMPVQQQQSYYYPTQPNANQGVIFACTSPVFANSGQYAQGYAPDNFYLFPNGQMVNCDANGGRCPVNYRPINSEQELQILLQSLGGGITPAYPTGNGNYPTPAPPHQTGPSNGGTQTVPPTATPKRKGPNYNKSQGGGLGN